MAKLIDYSKSLKQVDLFFEQYNEGKTMGDPTRLKSSTKAVAYAIIRLYGNFLHTRGMLFVKGSIGAELYKDIPPLSTNNVRIAEKVNTTGRTVRTHIKKLVDAGLILKKITHGRKNNFELWVNPEILGVKKKLNLSEINSKITNEIIKAEEQEQNENTTPSTPPMRKNFPLNVSCDTDNRNIDNDNNSDVDKVSQSDDNSVSPKVETKDTTTETKMETRERTQPNNQKQENEQKKVAAKKTNTTGPLDDNNLTEATQSFAEQKRKELDIYLEKMINKLWDLAAMLIYSKMELEEHQVVIAKKHLRNYFKNCRSKEEANHWFGIWSKRLSMAANYYKNHPDFEIYTPSFYFDPTNEKGFVATRNWYVKYLKNKEKQAKSRFLNAVLRKLEANPDISVYAQATQTLSRFKDKQLMDKFNQKAEQIILKANGQ